DDHVQGGDELVATVDRREVRSGPGLVARQPRGPGRRGNDLGLLLETATQLRVDVRLDVQVAVTSQVRGQHDVERLFPLGDVWAERIAVEGLPERLDVAVRALTDPEELGGDVIGGRHLHIGEPTALEVTGLDRLERVDSDETPPLLADRGAALLPAPTTNV